MATLSTTPDIYDRFRAHMVGPVEQVGFFLADYVREGRIFVLHEWRPVPRNGYEFQSTFHVSLTDALKVEIIKWAWEADGALVEAHSHSTEGIAEFSSSDFEGFKDWVPHLWWRLRARPYAAIVSGGGEFDAIAWIDSPDEPEQVEEFIVENRRGIRPTRRSLSYSERLNEADRRGL